MIACIVLLLSLICCTTGCQATLDFRKEPISDRRLRTIDYKQLVGLLKEKPGELILIDVRTKDSDYILGHLPGAVHIPMKDLRGDDERIMDGKVVIVYGAANNSISTASAKKIMRFQRKHKGADLAVVTKEPFQEPEVSYIRFSRYDVFDFRGGIKAWVANGGRVVSGEKPR